MFANIENITVNYNENKFNIMVEFSKLPIESFNTKEEAEEFILGYKTGLNQTESMSLGKYYQECIACDMKHGVKYRKVNEIMEITR